MWYHYYDARTELELLEYELGYRTGETPVESVDKRDLRSKPPFAVWQATAWIGGLWMISLGLGLASQWLAQ